MVCPACFLQLPAVRARLTALVPRRGDPVHRYVHWQAYERDGRACRVCGVHLHPGDARAVVDRRLVPELDNVRTMCLPCSRRAASRRAPKRQPEQVAAPAPIAPAPIAPAGAGRSDAPAAHRVPGRAEPAPSAATRGVLPGELRRRIFTTSAGRCNLCGGLVTPNTGRLAKLHRGRPLVMDNVLLLCPDCRHGGNQGVPAGDSSVLISAEASGQLLHLTGVSERLAPMAAGLLISLGTLERYRRRGLERVYSSHGLRLQVVAGTVVGVEAEPGWSPVRWPGLRSLRRQYLDQRDLPRLDLVNLRLPRELLGEVQGLVASQGPGWSLELWLVQLLRQAVHGDTTEATVH